MPEILKFDTLETAYVSVAALIRYLREKEFVGRLHVTLEQFECDVFLYGSDEPSVWELNRSTGKEEQGQAALQRLLVRSREPGGVITVYEGATQTASKTATSPTAEETYEDHGKTTQPDLNGLIPFAGAIIGAVERAVETTGGEFAQQFYQARVEIGDDYPFMDPTVGGFDYANSKLELQSSPTRSALIQALVESLKRVVTRVAQHTDETGFRERVAAELASTVRQWPNGVEELKVELDQITGVRV
jgi:hypothetical protein